MHADFLDFVKKRFRQYEALGQNTFDQIPDAALFQMDNPDSNSIAIIVKHMWGNMLSRWTNFLTEDGEKSWRMRDAEFENDITTRNGLMNKWQEGWQCLYQALESISEADLNAEVTIRGEKLNVVDAILRQLAHYAYHVGQIVYAGKLHSGGKWISLSIPKDGSQAFNVTMFKNQPASQ